MNIITEEKAKERCEKYNFKFGGISRQGNYNSCRVYFICSGCNQLIDYAYAELNKRKTSLCKKCLDNSYRLPNNTIIERLNKFGASPVDLSQYKISTDIIDIRCKCEQIFKLRINDIPKCKNISCKKCKGLYINSDIDNFCKENNIKLIKIISNNKIAIQCTICNKKLCKSFRSLRIQKCPNLCRSCVISVLEDPRKKEKSEIQKVLKDNQLIGDLSQYKNASYKIPLICRCGKKFTRSWNTLRAYKLYKCIRCSRRQNKLEEFLESKIKEFNILYLLNDRSITGKEIDIYFPDIKFGIEINGAYWHSDLRRNKKYHLEKTKEFANNGIDIINIHEAEIRTKPKIITQIIKKKLGLIQKINTELFVNCIDTNIAITFLSKHYLKNKSIAQQYYGLFLDSEIVSCVGIRSKNNRNYVTSYCDNIYYNISNSIDYFIEHLSRNNILDNLTFYIDRRFWFNGISTRFAKIIKETNPTYIYSKEKKIIYRSQINPQNANRYISNYDTSKNLYENMTAAKYFRIWDCGNLVYGWKNE